VLYPRRAVVSTSVLHYNLGYDLRECESLAICSAKRGEPLSKQDEVIRASEVGLYTFCARAWWLGQVLGYRSANLAEMQRGAVQHRAHGRTVVSFHRLRRVAVILLVLAGIALAIWFLLVLGR
jgi:hypothetical protein